MLESVACYPVPKGYFFAKPANAGTRNPRLATCSCGLIFNAAPTFSLQAPVSSIVLNRSLGNHCARLGREFLCKRHWLFSFSKSSVKIPHGGRGRLRRWRRLQVHAMIDVANAVDVINDLGTDTLTFLAVTVVVVPTFKILKASPILGFFFAGNVLNQFGLIRNLVDVKVLSEWGILFLLFEMGLELSLARLKALAKFAFAMGLTQVVLSTLAFSAFELPPNGAVGTRILEFLFHSRPDLVNIRTVDEAIVIGASLSLSSSAFVLQRKVSWRQGLDPPLWGYFSYRILRLFLS